MTTLHKSIEAAREAYHRVRDVLVIADKLAEQDLTAYQNLANMTGDKTYLERGRSRVLKAKESFADLDLLFHTLPAKPMTEDEIEQIVLKAVSAWYDNPEDDRPEYGVVVCALRDAGVLYIQGE